ncbi:MAG: pyridoxamine 5'-phosphate oxidase family protein [Haloarculaceae archaeon]
MDDSRSVEMGADEIAAFLQAHGTGVLSLAEGDEPYSVPVSYGYAAEEGCFYLRLGYRDGSEKPSFIEASASARLVVYDHTDEGWKSVIAVGDLSELSKADLTPDLVEQLSQAELPHFEMWEEPKEELEFTINQLDVTRVTGRRAGR